MMEPVERLSGMDASFLYFETPSMHMHVAMTAIFDPSTVPDGYSFDKVKEFILSRLHLVPPFRPAPERRPRSKSPRRHRPCELLPRLGHAERSVPGCGILIGAGTFRCRLIASS